MQRLMFVWLLLAAGCSAQSAAEQAGQSQRVYWDSESNGPVAAALNAETPAVHPATGRRTLRPALYCGQCRDWRAAAPLSELQRNPKSRLCTRCKGPLIADGPLPDASSATKSR